MKKFSEAQLQQLTELENDTSKQFRELVEKYTSLVSTKELDSIYNEAIELENSDDDYVYSYFDMDFYSILSDYYPIETDLFKEVFGYYGVGTIYMDNLGRGLMVEYL